MSELLDPMTEQSTNRKKLNYEPKWRKHNRRLRLRTWSNISIIFKRFYRKFEIAFYCIIHIPIAIFKQQFPLAFVAYIL